MKKNFKFMLAALCSIALFTACSSDDPESWTQLPKEEITAASGDLSLSVNGQLSQNGKATFNAISATEGVVTLTDAIPGYQSVPVDVTMTELENGSFNFNGTTDLTTAPSRAEAAGSDKAFMTIEVNGTITTDGKAIINITASGAAFYIGVYRNDSIALTYCDIPCPGRAAAYSAVNDVPVLTLIGVIPGDYTVAIPGVYPDANGEFEGETTTENGTTVAYTGKFNAGSGVLEMNVVPTLGSAAQGGIAKTWNLSLDPESTIDDNYDYHPTDYPAFRLIWSAIDENETNGQNIATLGSRAVSHFMVDLLSNVSLNTNGTFTAKYGDINYVKSQLPDFNDTENMFGLIGWFFGLLDVNMTPTQTTWYESPAGLAYWYCRDGYFYFVPDIMQIVAQANKDNGDSDVSPEMIMGLISQLSQMEPAALINYANQILPSIGLEGVDLSDVNPETIRTILTWLQTGVPLKYSVDGDYLSLYIDKEMADPFMVIIFKFLPALQNMMDEMAAQNPMMSMMYGLLGIEKFTDIQTIWESNTDEFKIALNFNQNAQQAPSQSMSRTRGAARKNYVQKFESAEEAFSAMKAMLK